METHYRLSTNANAFPHSWDLKVSLLYSAAAFFSGGTYLSRIVTNSSAALG
jgi:hypothetical protein